MREVWLAVALTGALWSCGDDDGAAPMTDSGSPGTDSGMEPTDGGGGTDAGGMGTDSGPPVDAGDGFLTNEPATCAKAGYTFADPANAGHYAAARLTPPRFPFTVTSVTYTLMHNPGECDADQLHDVLVFTSADGMPAGTPTGATMSVSAPPSPTPVGTSRVVTLALDSPITVNSGEDLYVAVQMVRATDPLCLEECLDMGEADRNWWSAAASTPFPWRTLASYGNMGTLTPSALGD